MPGQFMESIKFNFQESYGKFKMCSTCATYTDLSFLIIDEIHGCDSVLKKYQSRLQKCSRIVTW